MRTSPSSEGDTIRLRKRDLLYGRSELRQAAAPEVLIDEVRLHDAPHVAPRLPIRDALYELVQRHSLKVFDPRIHRARSRVVGAGCHRHVVAVARHETAEIPGAE